MKLGVRYGRLAGFLLLCLTAPALAEETVTVRTGNHSDFGRVVFDLPPGATWHLSREGDRVTVRFGSNVTLEQAAAVPRNVVSLVSTASQAELVLADGARLTTTRIGTRLVIDALDPASTKPDKPAATEPAAKSPPTPAPAKPRARAAEVGSRAASDKPAAGSTASPAASPAAAVSAAPAAASPGAGEIAPARTAPASPLPKGTRQDTATQPAATQPAATQPGPAQPGPAQPGATQPGAAKPSSTSGVATRPSVSPPASPSGFNAAPPGRPIAAPSPPAAAPASATSAQSPQTSPAPPANAPAPGQAGAPPTATNPARSAGVPILTDDALPPLRLTGTELLDGPVALVPRRAVLPPGTVGGAIVVPFASGTGAAMFSRGRSTFIVFDERRPIDFAGLRTDRLFGNASVRLLPAATLLRLQLPVDRVATLAQTPQGWRIAVVAGAPRLAPIAPATVESRIALPAEAPGQIVTMADPDSGATLLIGTQRRAGQGVLTPRRGAEFTLLPTAQGVVAEPLADRVALRIVPNGFALVGEPGGLLLSSASDAADLLADAAALTRRFQFPNMPTQSLSAHMIEQLDEAAAVPPQARGPRRVAVARSMLALGLAAEALGMLQMAAEQAPREGMSAELAGLSGVAALLSGRPDESAGLLDPRLSGTDEVALWRAIRGAMRQEGSPRAAAVMAATARLALTYPPPIRDRILPIIAETMILGGEVRPAAALLAQRKDEPTLAYARGMLKQAEGDAAGALAIYDSLTASRDQRDRSRAAVRAVELRLSDGAIDVHQAADRLDKLLYAWRGDGQELALRERVASLRQQGGAWAAALATLRTTEADFPEVAAATRARLQETFAALLKDDTADKLPPLELVALVDANADLLPATAEGEALQARLADRLLALDLPKRADPLLEKLIQSAPTDVGRATFGERLAALRLRENNAAGALSALDASKGADLPDELTQRRTMLFANASAKVGAIGAATAALSTLATPAADEARAAILEKAQDWPAAEQALRDYVEKTVPVSGPLDEPQRRTLLRLATAAARAGDDGQLAALREQRQEQVGDGPLADMFRLLTADPVRASGDLKRAGQEAGLARSIPSGLKALQPTGSP